MIKRNVILLALVLIFNVFPTTSQADLLSASNSTGASFSSDKYTPLLETVKSLGANLSWMPETGIVTISSGKAEVRLMPGSRYLVAGDVVITLKEPPFFKRGILFVDMDTVSRLSGLLGKADVSLPSVDAERVDRLFKTIVIDPGHGGRDGGAIGPDGTKEKDLVLVIAREVKRLIEQKIGVRVLLTREGDYFVPLEERNRIASSAAADIFVSIHANSTKRSSIRGIETFFMSLEASDEDAMAAAEAENSVVLLEEKADSMDVDLAAILFDMAQTEHMEDSSRFAKALHGNMGKALDTTDRGVKQAPFIVLAGATMPAVLVELGFMSNRLDLEMLNSSAARQKIASAVYKSILGYKTLFEAKREGDSAALD
ncbi:MAG: N-acetylmuramoyl-L-alanine amidase [Proteobacteria bacterium]|nr:N-acetylmuramoyl-L-alanine amidase [Pseudomonadota bacterium]